MTSVWKNVYIDKINKNNNICHRKIKMKPGDVKSNVYIDSSKEVNDKNSKTDIDYNVRITKYKNVSAKNYVLN